MSDNCGTVSKAHRGARNYHSGLAAEEAVARHYALSGAEVLDTRWRGKAGEIDLVLRQGKDVVFVEVKHAATCAAAAERLTFRQVSRVVSAAEEYIARLPGGLLTPMRLDAALVDGQGRIEIIENLSTG
jgi:putative endonuclease